MSVKLDVSRVHVVRLVAQCCLMGHRSAVDESKAYSFGRCHCQYSPLRTSFGMTVTIFVTMTIRFSELLLIGVFTVQYVVSAQEEGGRHPDTNCTRGNGGGLCHCSISHTGGAGGCHSGAGSGPSLRGAQPQLLGAWPSEGVAPEGDTPPLPSPPHLHAGCPTGVPDLEQEPGWQTFPDLPDSSLASTYHLWPRGRLQRSLTNNVAEQSIP